MPKTRKTKGIYRRGKVYWITFMGLDGKQKYESTGSDLKADAVNYCLHSAALTLTRARNL